MGLAGRHYFVSLLLTNMGSLKSAAPYVVFRVVTQWRAVCVFRGCITFHPSKGRQTLGEKRQCLQRLSAICKSSQASFDHTPAPGVYDLTGVRGTGTLGLALLGGQSMGLNVQIVT